MSTHICDHAGSDHCKLVGECDHRLPHEPDHVDLNDSDDSMCTAQGECSTGTPNGPSIQVRCVEREA